jgi:hypothetical protein
MNTQQESPAILTPESLLTSQKRARVVFLLRPPRRRPDWHDRALATYPGACYVSSAFCGSERSINQTDSINFFRFRRDTFTTCPALSIPTDENQRALLRDFLAATSARSQGSLSIVAISYNQLHHFETVWRWATSTPRFVELAKSFSIPVLHVIRSPRECDAGQANDASSWIARWRHSYCKLKTKAALALRPPDPRTERIRKYFWAYPHYAELKYHQGLDEHQVHQSLEIGLEQLGHTGCVKNSKTTAA